MLLRQKDGIDYEISNDTLNYFSVGSKAGRGLVFLVSSERLV
jgi:hypothetical protein